MKVFSIVPLLAACSSSTPTAQQPHLAPEVQILTQSQMQAFCAIDSREDCKFFRTPPVEPIAYFEDYLDERLRQRGLERIAGQIHGYLRQYWATLRMGRLMIVGNYVCWSEVASDLEHLEDEPRPEPGPRRLPSGPVIVDDAGDCNVTVEFAADSPK